VRHQQGQFLANLGRLQIDLERLHLRLKFGDLLLLGADLQGRSAAWLGLQGFQGRLKHLLALQAKTRSSHPHLGGGLGNGDLPLQGLEHQVQSLAALGRAG